MTEVVVVGQVARDLVLCVGEVPGPGGTTNARYRREVLGGKGANQAVGLTQLGLPVAVVGVVGDDRVGRDLLAQAQADGVHTGKVVCRPGTVSGLVVDIVDEDGHWHYVEDLSELLTEDDVQAAADVLHDAKAVVVQLQQPAAAALAAARAAGGLVVLDGKPAERANELLSAANVLRADAHEAGELVGKDLAHVEAAVRAGQQLVVEHDLDLVAVGYDGGDAFVWPGAALTFPHGDAEVVDTTGAGDALTAALTSVLCRGGDQADAARLAVAAAAVTVEHPGGRPDLSPARLAHRGSAPRRWKW